MDYAQFFRFLIFFASSCIIVAIFSSCRSHTELTEKSIYIDPRPAEMMQGRLIKLSFQHASAPADGTEECFLNGISLGRGIDGFVSLLEELEKQPLGCTIVDVSTVPDFIRPSPPAPELVLHVPYMYHLQLLFAALDRRQMRFVYPTSGSGRIVYEGMGRVSWLDKKESIEIIEATRARCKVKGERGM